MKAHHVSILVVMGCAIVVLNAVGLKASDRVGIYAIVEKVVVEPSEAAPERIQIWGVFALADANHGDNYFAPQRGYLYYSLPSTRVAGQRLNALNEWADLKSVAGKGEAVGFGGRYLVTGRVRKETETPDSPDVFPVQMGIVKIVNPRVQPAIFTQLREALRSR